MKNAFLVIIVLVFSALLNLSRTDAQEKRMSVGNCVDIFSALSSMDTYNDEAGKPHRYKYKGRARMTIGLNVGALRPIYEAAEKVRLGLIAEAGDKQTESERAKLSLEYQKQLEAPCSVILGHLNVADLNVGDEEGENNFPLGIIGVIAPILNLDK